MTFLKSKASSVTSGNPLSQVVVMKHYFFITFNKKTKIVKKCQNLLYQIALKTGNNLSKISIITRRASQEI